MKSTKLFYIGERINPQLSKSYYNAYGLLSKSESLRKKDCAYGSMHLTAYNTKEEYLNAIEKLKNDGFKVNDYEIN